MRVELMFPIAIITLFATVAYMIYASGAWSWRDGRPSRPMLLPTR